jgi:hypothetical protein
VTTRVINELSSRSKNAEKAEEYQKFFENFGPVLKEGIYEYSGSEVQPPSVEERKRRSGAISARRSKSS